MHCSLQSGIMKCHDRCFNRRGCSSQLRNEQVLNHQDHTYMRLTSISWCLDTAAPQLLDAGQRYAAAHPEIFCSGNLQLVDAADTARETEHRRVGTALQKWRQSCRGLQGVRLLFASIAALGFYPCGHYCSWDCKATRTWEAEGNPVLTERHRGSPKAIAPLCWGYGHRKPELVIKIG